MKNTFLYFLAVLSIGFIVLTAFSDGGTDEERVAAQVEDLKKAYLNKADQNCRLEAKKEAQAIWEEENSAGTEEEMQPEELPG